MTEELRPKRRTKATPEEIEANVVTAQADPEYVSPLREPDLFPEGDPQDANAPEDVDLRGEFAAIVDQTFADPSSGPAVETRRTWQPRDEHMIDVRGGAKYLPARRRVQWMRQEPAPHPDWAIKTTQIHFVMGEVQGPQRIGGGYASFKAEVFDEAGRLISTGHAQEFSENFFDYLEKAETSAVARALALAGYGTESALDLDEGFIADSPFRRDGQMGGDIKIESSNLRGLKQGGRSEHATEAQIDAIRRRARELDLTPDALVDVIAAATNTQLELDPIAEKERAGFVLDSIRKMTFEDAAAVVQTLLAAEQSDEEAR